MFLNNIATLIIGMVLGSAANMIFLFSLMLYEPKKDKPPTKDEWKQL